ncbi:MAG: DUF423 domain-containing protein [Burkholderiaceae bacterium]|nr:DUF423 domain-containing protein [Burkholderiaceae bacterium]
MIDRVFFSLGCVLGFTGVGLGAFGAHALKARLAPEHLATFEVGVRYQLIHALALLAVAWACAHWPGRLAPASGWLFVTGTLLFSGSLYAITLGGVRGLGLVTPLGGVALLLGWLCLLAAPWSPRRDR